jgi:hypothetical protein
MKPYYSQVMAKKQLWGRKKEQTHLLALET